MSSTERSAAWISTAVGSMSTLSIIGIVEGLGTSAPVPLTVATAGAVGLCTAAINYFGVGRPLTDQITAERSSRQALETELTISRQRRGFVEQLDAAIDMADTEDEVVGIVGRALAILLPERENFVLLAPPDEPRVTWSIGATELGLDAPVALGRPERCSALSLRQSVYVSSSSGLDACPHLSVNDCEVSSACIPIRIGDFHLGVAHSIGPTGDLPDDEARRLLELVTRRAGARIATLRAARNTNDHIAVDPLTKLPNHTFVQARLRQLIDGEDTFALAFCDLDDFSGYNDINGSETGDTALRLYSKVMQATLRPGDVIARYAGDRFLCLFPKCSADHAASAMERVREALVLELSIQELSPFTVSVGVVDAADGSCVEDLLETADVTLSVAKYSGGNRVSKAKFDSIEN